MKAILDKILIKEIIAPILIILFSTIICKIVQNIVKRTFRIKSGQASKKKKETLIGVINNIRKD